MALLMALAELEPWPMMQTPLTQREGAAPVGFVAPSLLGRLEGILGDERPKLTNR